MDSEIIGLYLLAGLIVFIGIMFIVAIISYVLQGIAFQRMANKLKLENSWYAWIPLLNIYLVGKLAGDRIKVGSKCVTNMGGVLVGGVLGYTLLSGIINIIENEILVLLFLILQVVIYVVYMILYYMAIYKIYRVFDEKKATRNTILSIVIGILQPFLLLSVSNKEPNLELYLENYDTND